MPPTELSVNQLAPSVWIKAQRRRKRLTPYHVAAKMGIAASLVRAWESGKSRPTGI